MAQTFYPTAQQVVDAALRVIAATDPESTSTPTTTERTNSLEAFNFLVTSWQAHGMQVWCQKLVSYTLSAASSYTIGPSGADITAARPLEISQAWIRSTDTYPIDIPMNIIPRDTYNLLSSKSNPGTPNQLFYDPEYDRDASNSGANAKGKVYVWPTPDSTIVTNYDLYMVTTRPIQDFNATSDTLDFPQYWFNAVKWNLALHLSFEYGVPIEEKVRIEKIAKEALDLAMSYDVEHDSVTFMPDYRFKGM